MRSLGAPCALQVLLQMGADPNIASHDGASPLFIASYQNNHECSYKRRCKCGYQCKRQTHDGDWCKYEYQSWCE